MLFSTHVNHVNVSRKRNPLYLYIFIAVNLRSSISTTCSRKLFRSFPKFLDFKLSRREFHDTKACRRFKEDLLSFEIKQKTILRRKHMMSVESILSTLKTVLSPLDFSHIRSSIEAKTAKIKDRLSSKLERKFNNLKRRYGIPQVSNLSYDSVIFNYSHRALTEAEKMVLARGLRFCLPPKAVDGVSVKCAFEMLYRDLIGLGHYWVAVWQYGIPSWKMGRISPFYFFRVGKSLACHSPGKWCLCA